MAALLGITALWGACEETDSTATVRNALMSVPREIAPLLTQHAILDMLDYYDAGMDNPTANVADGHMRIAALTAECAELQAGDVLTVDVVLLPCGADTLRAYIATCKMPRADSRMLVYDADGKDVTRKVFAVPDLSKWLTPQGKKQRKMVESKLTYYTMAYAYDKDTRRLVIEMSFPATMSVEDTEALRPLLRYALGYVWNGKKFVAEK